MIFFLKKILNEKLAGEKKLGIPCEIYRKILKVIHAKSVSRKFLQIICRVYIENLQTHYLALIGTYCKVFKKNLERDIDLRVVLTIFVKVSVASRV